MDEDELNKALERVRGQALQWPALVIDGERQFVAYEAERRLALGKVSAWEAMLRCALAGVPIPGAVLDALRNAQTAYNDGECNDLAIPLGVAVSDENKEAMALLIGKRQIAYAVSDEIKGGAKTKPSKREPTTAFELAAKRVKRITASKLKKFQSLGSSTARAAYYDPDCADIVARTDSEKTPVPRKRQKT